MIVSRRACAADPCRIQGRRFAIRGLSPNFGGFTLIELLVVLVIIGVILSLATLHIGGESDQELHDEAQRLEALLQLAKNQAVLQGRELALNILGNGYGFLVQDNDNKWIALEGDEVLRHRDIPDAIKLHLLIDGEAIDLSKQQDPQDRSLILIMSSGEITPFVLTMESGIGQGLRYELRADAFGQIEISRA